MTKYTDLDIRGQRASEAAARGEASGMTREQFIAGYCERSNITWEKLSDWRDAVPCRCEEKECEGWAMVSKGLSGLDLSLETHIWPDDAALLAAVPDEAPTE